MAKTILTSTDVSDAVSHLVTVCRDGEFGFEMAAAGIADRILRAELLQYSVQRKEFAAELNTALRQLGHPAVEHGSVAGALHRGWIKVKEAVESRNEIAVLKECIRGEDVALDAYRKASAAQLPALIAGLVSSQLMAIIRVRDRLERLQLNLHSQQN